MAETIACPHCGNRYRLQAELAGKKVKCAGCAQVFQMPAPAAQRSALSTPHPLTESGSPGAKDLFSPPVSRDVGAAFAAEDPFAVAAPVILNPLDTLHRRRAWMRRLKIGGIVAAAVGAVTILVTGAVFLIKTTSENWPLRGAIPGESFVQDMLASVNEMAEIVASIKDVDTAKAAVARLKALRPRFESLSRQFEEVRKIKLTPEQERELEDRYGAQLEAVLERTKTDVARLRSLPGVLQVLAEADLAAMSTVPGNFRLPQSLLPLRQPARTNPAEGSVPSSASSSASSPVSDDAVEQLVRAYGKEKILTVTVEEVPAEQMSFVGAKIRETTGARGVVRCPPAAR